MVTSEDLRAPVIPAAEERRILQEALRRSQDGGPVRVLEAGCGRRWHIDPGVPVSITGVDADATALRLRKEQQGDLDEAVLGDLRTVPLPTDAFDVAYCSYVLEHVEGAEEVLDKLAAAVRPGGRLIVQVPDGDSVYGFVTKHTPHRTHVWFKRYVQRAPHAGEPGYAPYPTVYDPVVSLRGLRTWARSRGLEIETEYATNGWMSLFRRSAPLVALVLRVISRLSRGRLAPDHNNIGLVFVKRS